MAQMSGKCFYNLDYHPFNYRMHSLFTISSHSQAPSLSTNFDENEDAPNCCCEKMCSRQDVKPRQTQKSPMYVHKFNKKNESLTNLKPFQSYYDERTEFMMKKFNNLSLNNEMSKNCKECLCPLHLKPCKCKKFDINKLEETYWAKWKPSKTLNNDAKSPVIKTKTNNIDVVKAKKVLNEVVRMPLPNVNLGNYVQCKTCLKYIEKNANCGGLDCLHEVESETTETGCAQRQATICECDEDQTTYQEGETTEVGFTDVGMSKDEDTTPTAATSYETSTLSRACCNPKCKAKLDQIKKKKNPDNKRNLKDLVNDIKNFVIRPIPEPQLIAAIPGNNKNNDTKRKSVSENGPRPKTSSRRLNINNKRKSMSKIGENVSGPTNSILEGKRPKTSLQKLNGNWDKFNSSSKTEEDRSSRSASPSRITDKSSTLSYNSSNMDKPSSRSSHTEKSPVKTPEPNNKNKPTTPNHSANTTNKPLTSKYRSSSTDKPSIPNHRSSTTDKPSKPKHRSSADQFSINRRSSARNNLSNASSRSSNMDKSVPSNRSSRLNLPSSSRNLSKENVTTPPRKSLQTSVPSSHPRSRESNTLPSLKTSQRSSKTSGEANVLSSPPRSRESKTLSSPKASQRGLQISLPVSYEDVFYTPKRSEEGSPIVEKKSLTFKSPNEDESQLKSPESFHSTYILLSQKSSPSAITPHLSNRKLNAPETSVLSYEISESTPQFPKHYTSAPSSSLESNTLTVSSESPESIELAIYSKSPEPNSITISSKAGEFFDKFIVPQTPENVSRPKSPRGYPQEGQTSEVPYVKIGDVKYKSISQQEYEVITIKTNDSYASQKSSGTSKNTAYQASKLPNINRTLKGHSYPLKPVLKSKKTPVLRSPPGNKYKYKK